jgi:serine/threonine-protein kinase HipA
MRLEPGKPLKLSLAFSHDAPPLLAGRVATDRGLAQLEWSRDVVVRKLLVAPLYYPPEMGLQPARGRDFEGLHGFLADSLPDGWGYLVMRRRLARLGVDIAGLSPLDRLALVGRHGRGAMVFDPATTPEPEVETLDIDALAAEAAALLAGDEGRLANTLAALAGASGGARPKVHVGYDAEGRISVGEGEMPEGYVPWLVKFRGPSDPLDIGPIEEAYAQMAEAAGLTMSPHGLVPARTGPGYFAARRFDRPEGGGRLHMVSLAGAIEAAPHLPSASYDMFLRATSAITRSAVDVRAAFQRMVFNVLAGNRDDHTRQHAYLMTESGDWRLAPAYDLTYSAGPGGAHYMDVEGEGRNPSRAHVLRLGARHGFDAKAVGGMIETVRAALADWPALAHAAGVMAASQREIGAAHARVWASFNPS